MRHLNRFRFWAFATAATFVAAIVFTIINNGSPHDLMENPAAWLATKANLLRPRLNLGNNSACIEQLAQLGLRVEGLPNRVEDQACVLDHTVRSTGPQALFRQPRFTTCSLARSLARFEDEHLQPLAQELFQQRVTNIRSLGTYNCRPMRGQSLWLSEHGYANAIDIAAFTLADGGEIVVARHWKDSGPKGDFLRRAARSACRHFRRVVTPNTDRHHHDHFHFDNGILPGCQS